MLDKHLWELGNNAIGVSEWSFGARPAAVRQTAMATKVGASTSEQDDVCNTHLQTRNGGGWVTHGRHTHKPQGVGEGVRGRLVPSQLVGCVDEVVRSMERRRAMNERREDDQRAHDTASAECPRIG